MRKYIVKVFEVYVKDIEVMADDAQAAKEEANRILEEGGDDKCIEYSHTLDVDAWDITEVVDPCSKCRKCGETNCGNDTRNYTCLEDIR